jgi:hypothetical protein
MNSLVLDYVARHKIGGASLSYFILKQLPVPTPERYGAPQIAFIVPRVLELVYSAWDVRPFADDLWRESDEPFRQTISSQWEENRASTSGDEWNLPESAGLARDGIPLPPFKWDEDRRARIRAELDAYYAYLYGLTRDELRYILAPQDVCGPDFPGETFRVLKEKEEKLYGEFRTRRLVLEAYDHLLESIPSA